MTAMNSNRKTGRRYDREFKNNAVALVHSGRTVTEVARDLIAYGLKSAPSPSPWLS
jgi:transposase-like protein